MLLGGARTDMVSVPACMEGGGRQERGRANVGVRVGESGRKSAPAPEERACVAKMEAGQQRPMMVGEKD